MVEEERVNEMRIEEPYFMKNPEWFYFDETQFKYVLTDKATEKAKKSYEDYYENLDDKTVD